MQPPDTLRQATMLSHSVEAVAPAPSNAVRAHDHPILETGNLAFPEGRYVLDFKAGADRSSYTITHHITSAPLITRLLDTQQARYVCIVSSPISSYRATHVSDDAQHEVRWDADELGEPPMFTPVIVCSEALAITLDASRDGVHRIWDKQKINLQKGSRLALGSVIQLESSILHLLSLHEDANLKDGQFVVELESEPFRFRVNVSTKLHQFLRYRPGEHRSNIMTHIVTACLARLQSDHTDDDGETGWESHRNLKAFADYLAHEGHGHWTDDDFRPEKVATALYPLKLPENASNYAGEDEGA